MKQARIEHDISCGGDIYIIEKNLPVGKCSRCGQEGVLLIRCDDDLPGEKPSERIDMVGNTIFAIFQGDHVSN